MDTEELICIFIDDDSERLADCIANVTDITFQLTNTKYRYGKFLELSEGAPLESIAAYFSALKCFEFLQDTQIKAKHFKCHPFCYACAGGNMEIIRRVCIKFPESLNFNLYANYDDIWRPGFLAIHNGHCDVVKFLCLKGYQFRDVEIIEACALCTDDIVIFIMNNTNILNNNENLVYKMLVKASDFGNRQNIEHLLTKYTFKRMTKKKYQSLIFSACQNGNINCLKYLIEKSANFFPRISNYFIQVALEYASKFEYLDIINYLIRHGGKINDVESEKSPLINALTSNSFETAKLYLDILPKIPNETVNMYFSMIFEKNYSFEIIQMLLQYSNKTLFDVREEFSNYAFKNNIGEFFDELVKNNIQLNFLKIEMFNDCPDRFDMFKKLYELGAPFQFDANNPVFVFALKVGDIDSIDYFFSKGAILSDEVISASKCLGIYGSFYRNEHFINLLFEYNINLANYPNFICNLAISCRRKVFLYENLALKAVNDHGAIVTYDVFKEIISVGWWRLFSNLVSRNIYYNLKVDDIPLNIYRTHLKNHMNIIRKIFEKQPGLINAVKMKIILMNIEGEIADFIKKLEGINNDDSAFNSDDDDFKNMFDVDISEWDHL